MSYILEALRRAESERERKRGVPGLHAQPVPMPSPDDLGERRATPWRWVVGVLSIGVLLLILWRWWSVEPLVDAAELARAPVAGNVSPGTIDPPATASAAPAPAPTTTPATHAQEPAPKPNVTERPPRTGRPATPPRSASATTTPRNPAPTTEAPPPAAPAPTGPAPNNTVRNSAAPPAPAAAPPEPRLRTLAELPEDLRRNVPPIAFGGSVYSDTPAQRMVILNGQVLREGDVLSDDLQIEQIRPRSAVLRVRGQRFEMPF